MDTRDSPEHAELRRSARQLARELGAATVAELDDATRAQRLADAVRAAGWLELRDDGGAGEPLAGGIEAAIVADALGGAAADVGFSGRVLARDLARRAGIEPVADAVVAFTVGLADIAVAASATPPAYAVDADGSDAAYVLIADGTDFRLGTVAVEGENGGSDLTRAVRPIPAGATIVAAPGARRALARDDLAQSTALGLALTSADLVGVMRGVLEVTVAYAADRRQYGVPIGSFQAVQHLLAEAHCLMEGSLSVAQYAAWAVDELAPHDTRAAGRVAKAYCARAARTVCETAVQVHGGVGNTWECIAHVYLRRALLSTQWFGDDGHQLFELERERLGATVGLS